MSTLNVDAQLQHKNNGWRSTADWRRETKRRNERALRCALLPGAAHCGPDTNQQKVFIRNRKYTAFKFTAEKSTRNTVAHYESRSDRCVPPKGFIIYTRVVDSLWRCSSIRGYRWNYLSARCAARFIQVGCGLFTTLPHRVVARDWSMRTCIASNGVSGTASRHAVLWSHASILRATTLTWRTAGAAHLINPARDTIRIRAFLPSVYYTASDGHRRRLRVYMHVCH